MVTTSHAGLWSRMWSYKDHGKSWEAVYERRHPPGFRWLCDSFGTNGRMLEVQAAIGRIQLTRMPAWTDARRAAAERIWQVARMLPGLRAPVVPDWAEHAAYKAYVFIQPDALKNGWDRGRIVASISARGVPCYSGSCPEIYLEQAFSATGWRPTSRLPVARELGETSVMFLVHPTLEARHIDKTCNVLRAVMESATR